jgi:phenylpropionate dioxygenase-like ring-hydroxylating dioxygenase large terminal subunit
MPSVASVASVLSVSDALIAHAGRLKPENMTFTKVAKVADVAAGTIKGFLVGDKKVAIANANGKFYAFEDRCAHAGARLSTGLLLGNMVMCIAHGAQFDRCVAVMCRFRQLDYSCRRSLR